MMRTFLLLLSFLLVAVQALLPQQSTAKIHATRRQLTADQLKEKLANLDELLPRELVDSVRVQQFGPRSGAAKFGAVEEDNEAGNEGGEEQLKDFGGLMLLGDVAVGSPPQHFQLGLLLTGSQMWLVEEGAKLPWNLVHHKVQRFQKSKSSTFTQGSLVQEFQTDHKLVRGKYISDMVQLANVLPQNITFGLASRVSRLYSLLPVDGQLGLSPSPTDHLGVPSALAQLMSNLAHPILSLWMDSQSIIKEGNGQLTLGKLDVEKCNDDWSWVEMADESGWHFSLESVSIKGRRVPSFHGIEFARLIDGLPFIVGPGSHVFMIAQALDASPEVIAGIPIYAAYKVNCDLLSTGPNLVFHLGHAGHTKVVLTPHDYIIKFPNEMHCMLALVGYPDIKSFGYFFGERLINGRCLALDYGSKQIGFATNKQN